jgi:hypothetical protein
MKRLKINQTQVKLTAEQEQRLAKLYSILDMINPVQPAPSQTQTDYENEKTVIFAEANAS